MLLLCVSRIADRLQRLRHRPANVSVGTWRMSHTRTRGESVPNNLESSGPVPGHLAEQGNPKGAEIVRQVGGKEPLWLPTTRGRGVSTEPVSRRSRLFLKTLAANEFTKGERHGKARRADGQ
jgi:hypothetical protein